MVEEERNEQIAALLEKVEHIIKMIIRKEKRLSVPSPLYSSILSLMKDCEKIHLNRARDTLIKTLN